MLVFIVLAVFATAQGFVLKSDERIINGDGATIEKFPFQASVRVDDHHICGGSILNEKSILTAAHCVYKKDQSKFTVRVGNTKHGSGKSYKVVKIYRHEKYNKDHHDYDVAILKLGTSLKFSSSIKPVKLEKKEVSNGSNAVASGWGATDAGGHNKSPKLLSAKFKILNTKECKKEFSSGKITDRMICAKSKKQDVCNGDSGGPLIVNNKLVGVVSWGKGCLNKKHPSVFAKVSNLYSWIESHS